MNALPFLSRLFHLSLVAEKDLDSMPPLRDDILTLRYIAELWSRELSGIRTADEIEAELLAGFWRGEFAVRHKTGTKRQIYRSAMLRGVNLKREHPGFSFVDSADLIPSQLVEHADGGATVDLRQYIVLPSDPNQWTDDLREAGYEALAETALEDYDPLILPVMATFSITKEVFANFCDESGRERPRFWFVKGRNDKWTARSERNVEKWFKGITRGAKRKPKSVYRAEAAKLFNVPGKAFDRIWKRLAPEAWERSGPVVRSDRK